MLHNGSESYEYKVGVPQMKNIGCQCRLITGLPVVRPVKRYIVSHSDDNVCYYVYIIMWVLIVWVLKS